MLKGQSAEGMFAATFRLEVEAMKVQITRMFADQLEGGALEKAIEKAVEQTLEPAKLEATIKSEVDRAMKRLVERAVDHALTYNDEARDALERSVRNVVRTTLVDRFSRD